MAKLSAHGGSYESANAQHVGLSEQASFHIRHGCPSELAVGARAGSPQLGSGVFAWLLRCELQSEAVAGLERRMPFAWTTHVAVA